MTPRLVVYLLHQLKLMHENVVLAVCIWKFMIDFQLHTRGKFPLRLLMQIHTILNFTQAKYKKSISQTLKNS